MSTNRQTWLKVVAVTLVVVIGLGSELALAQSYDPDQTIPKPTLWEKRLTKLGRGVSNILFGWTEIPVTFDRKLKEGKPLAYLVGVVPVVGTARAFMRTGVGVTELFTFAKTKPEINYEAMLLPEYIF